MTADIIDGTQIAADVRAELVARIDALQARGVTPGIAFVLVGEHPSSMAYVRGKERASAQRGITSETFRLPESAPQSEIAAMHCPTMRAWRRP